MSADCCLGAVNQSANPDHSGRLPPLLAEEHSLAVAVIHFHENRALQQQQQQPVHNSVSLFASVDCAVVMAGKTAYLLI
jgi:hypothetical protein